MRLKFLFFPLILVVSISIFAGYIWPEISNLRIANEEKMKHNEEIESINNKKAAIQRLDAEINGDSEGEDTINGYLPSSPVEERILTAVNFLATDSEVSLVNISFDDNSVAKKIDDLSLLSGGSSLATAANTSNQEQQDTSSKSEMQTMRTSIAISGEYEKIRLFIDQMQKMSPLNSIKNVSISTQAPEKKDTVETDGSATATASVPITSLSADLKVDFYWMSPVKNDSQKIANFKPGLDSKTIAIVKQYVSQKAPSVDKFGDNSGKRNPFLQ